MNLTCQDIRDQLTAFADGELDVLQQQDIQKHLDSCPACAQEVESHHALKAMLRRTFSLPEESRNLSGLWENIEAQLKFKPSFWQRMREAFAKPAIWIPSAVATATIALVVFWVTQSQKEIAPMVSQVESVAVNSSNEQVWVFKTAASGQPLIWIQSSPEKNKEAG